MLRRKAYNRLLEWFFIIVQRKRNRRSKMLGIIRVAALRTARLNQYIYRIRQTIQVYIYGKRSAMIGRLIV